MQYSDPQDGQMLKMVRIVRKYNIYLMEMRQLFCFRVLDRLKISLLLRALSLSQPSCAM